MACKGGLRRMDEPQIYQRLTEIFQDVFDEDSIEVTPKLSADDVDGWDSLTHIRLILSIEKVFKIKFSTSEIGKLENVGNLVALIQGKV
jgi:acyl carrier protein